MKDPDARRLSKQLGIRYVHALRLVRQAKQLAEQLKISYREAERHVVEGHKAKASSTPALAQLIRDAVEAACIDLAYREAEYQPHERPATGLPFGDVPLPRDTVENIAVELVEPDLDTLIWSVDEEFDGGTQAATVTLAAYVSFDGFVHKSVAHHLRDTNKDIAVVDLDWNDHMARVSFTRTANLAFHAVLHPELPAVDHLKFVEASDTRQSPGGPHA